MSTVIARGAEAVITEEDGVIVKTRVPKAYRIPEIDSKIIVSRTKREGKILKRLEENSVNVPKLLGCDRNVLRMEKIGGSVVRDILENDGVRIMRLIAAEIARMHNCNVIHGDLTTLNMIYTGSRVYLIDFGLGSMSSKDEDKAVDLYVFEKALRCFHSESFIAIFLEEYAKEGSSDVLKRFEVVRLRGRKREELAE